MKSICYLTLATWLCVSGAANAAAMNVRAAPPPSPVSVAIVDEGDKGYALRHFPSRLRLYTFDRDRPQESVCVDGCASAWSSLRADENATPIGDWTPVPRTDGTPQWAYKGKPVYLRYHDDPDAPAGDGEDGVWRLIPNIR
jgi:predicted lipoprotein with Yx(FWY)xxD motif